MKDTNVNFNQKSLKNSTISLLFPNFLVVERSETISRDHTTHLYFLEKKGLKGPKSPNYETFLM